MNKKAINKIGKITFFSFVIIFILLIGNVLATDWWPMFRHDTNHTGYSTSSINMTDFGVLWKYQTGDNVISSPIINEFLYIGSVDGHFYKLNITDGSLIWDYIGVSSYTIQGAATLENNIIYFGSSEAEGKIYALNATNGSLIWNYTTKGQIRGSPSILEDRLYLESSDNKTYSLNATTGNHIWNYTTGNDNNGLVIDNTPLVLNNVVYVGSWNNKTYALNATNGSLIWDYTGTGGFVSSPAIKEDYLYIGSADKNIYALNATNGSQIWNYTTGDLVKTSPAVANGIVYIGSDDNNIYALNATNGSLIWSYSTGNAIMSSPAVVGDIVFVGSNDDKLYALNATTGAHIWDYTTGDDIVSSPAIADGIVYVGSNDGYLYAFTDGQCQDTDSDGFGVCPYCNITNGCTYDGDDCDDTDANVYPPRDGAFINADTTLCSGTYTLNDTGNDGLIKINASDISLTCDGTIIIGNGSGQGIYADDDDNILVENCDIRRYEYGIYFEDTNNSRIQNNTVNSSTYGIDIMHGNFNNITKNTVINSSGGALSSGILLVAWGENVTENKIYNNTIYNNNPYGILVYSTSYGSNNNTIYNNNITQTYNTSIYIMENSTNNLIYNNYLSAPTPANDSGTSNSWNTTKTTATNIIGGASIGGNYYSTYTGTDSDSDGIGETTFTTSGTAGAIDYLPLTNTACVPDCSCAAATCTGSTCSDGCGGTCAGTKSCTSSCFPAGTKILMQDKTEKNIEDVEVGDFVTSYDFKNKKIVSAKVLELEEPIREGVYGINNFLNVTDEHPFYTLKKNGLTVWSAIDSKKAEEDLIGSELEGIKVFELEVGDKLFTSQGFWIKINSIKYFPGEIKTYNLKTVDKYNVFFANNVLVHNKDGCTETCSSKGYECGTHIICEVSKNCGNCSEGYTCESGKCVEAGQELFCEDSDDGLNYYVAGSVSGYHPLDGNYLFPDLCMSDGLKVKEWTCRGNVTRDTLYDCAQEGKICVDGKCVEGCIPDCDGKECGDNNCGGSCGTCDEDSVCENYICDPIICDPDWECSEWGECEVIYDFNNILNEEILLHGTSKRICTDKNTCIHDRIESMPCQISIPITINKTIWCFEEYFELFDKETGDFVGRIKDLQDINKGSKSLSIFFTENRNEEVCPYCFKEVFEDKTFDTKNWKWEGHNTEPDYSVSDGQYKISVVGQGDKDYYDSLSETDAMLYNKKINTWSGLFLEQSVLDNFKTEIDFSELEQQGYGAWRFVVIFKDNYKNIRVEFAKTPYYGTLSQVFFRTRLTPEVENFMDKSRTESEQKLTIERKGNDIIFYIDDEKFHEMNFDYLPRVGKIGFSQDVLFDISKGSVSVNEFGIYNGCYDDVCGDGIIGYDEECDGGEDCTENCEKKSPPTQCSDGIDNDEDKFIDLDDPGCLSYTDNNETNEIIVLCGNGELDEGEICDDGNLENLDGCDLNCFIEDYCFVSTFDQADGEYFNKKKGGKNPTANGWWLWGYDSPKNKFKDGKYKVDLHGYGTGFEEYGYEGLIGLKNNNFQEYQKITQEAYGVDGLVANQDNWLKDDFEIEFAFSNFLDYGEDKFYKPGIKLGVFFKDNKYVYASMKMTENYFDIYHAKDLSGKVNMGEMFIEDSSEYYIMKIKRQENKLIFYLNDEQVYETEFKSLPEVAQPVLKIDTQFKDVNVKADFEYFVIENGCYSSYCGDNIFTALGNFEECDGGESCTENCKEKDSSQKQCSDKIDNDKDFMIDLYDPGCENSQDNSEEGGDCIDDSCISVPICGNNRLDLGEQCEDGNLENLDGCSSVCIIEAPISYDDFGGDSGGGSEGGGGGGAIEKLFDLIPFVKKVPKVEQITDYEELTPIKQEKKSYLGIIIFIIVLIGITIFIIAKRKPIFKLLKSISFNRKKEKDIEKRLKKLFSD